MTLTRRHLSAGGLGLLGSTALVACSPTIPDTGSVGTTTGGTADALDPKVRQMLAAHGIEAATAEDAVASLDRVSKPRPLALTGSVGYDQVAFADDSDQVTVPLTGGQFYLSMAPYRTQTHECYYHNLGGCQGELVDTPVHVTVTTHAGQSLLDEDTTTATNGFTGFWIPRDHTGTVTVTAEGTTASTPFDSGPDGPTCLTTLHLA
ncbi:CueP family metal-binding protein [Micrococcus sp. IITD107]|uniref:CueP family metal-binding protein n=1 Tax=Micrococcus sp. IITD107 TaxID=3342790 RepID=UPI0035B7AAA6